MEDKSAGTKFLYRLVKIIYAAFVILMLLNLFIAMVTYTYDEFKQRSDALLLLEKYNIMHTYEKRMITYDGIHRDLERIKDAFLFQTAWRTPSSPRSAMIYRPGIRAHLTVVV